MKRFEVEGDEVTIANGRVYCGPMRYLAGTVERNGGWEAWLPPRRLTGNASSMMVAATLIARAWQAWRDEEHPASMLMDSAFPDGWEDVAPTHSRGPSGPGAPSYLGGPELPSVPA